MSLFSLGQISASPAVARLTVDERAAVLGRYKSGDWGDVPDELRAQNASALTNGGRIYAAYCLPSGKTLLLQSEGDRSGTFMQIADEDMSSKWGHGGRLLLKMTAQAFVKELFGR